MKKRFRKIRTVLWIILFANFLSALVKMVVGSMIKSVSLTADGYHSLTDGSSNIVGLIAIYLGAKPVDEDHPYGHKKFETLAALLIAVMLGFLGCKILFGAALRLANPVLPEVSAESLLALSATLGMNIFIARYERRIGKLLHSEILIADAVHTQSDIYISIGVLVTLTGIKLGLPAVIDPLISLAVAGFIFRAALEIFLPTCEILADRAALDHKVIADLVYQFQEVKNVHEIRSRGRDDEVFIDLHIETNPAMSVKDWHLLSHEIEETVRRKTGKVVQMMIHVEPYVTKPESLAQDLTI